MSRFDLEMVLIRIEGRKGLSNYNVDSTPFRYGLCQKAGNLEISASLKYHYSEMSGLSEVRDETIFDIFLRRREFQSHAALGKFVLISLALHLALFVFLWFYGPGLPRQIAKYTFLEVSLLEREPKRLAPLEKPAVKKTSKVQVEPKKAEELKKGTSRKSKPEEPVLPKEVKPRVPKRENTEVRLAKAERPKPRTTPRSSPAKAVTSARPVEQRPAPIPMEKETEFGSLEVESRNLPHWYVEVLREKITANWEDLRTLLPQGRYAKVVIRFEITRSGEFKDAPEVFQTSNIKLLDQSAYRAVVRSRPFPELPSQFEEDILGVRCGFVCGNRGES